MPHKAPDGWSYHIKDNREWGEIQIIARTPAGNLNEGRKSFYPYHDRVSKREARADAEQHLAMLLADTKVYNDGFAKADPRRSNPPRRNPAYIHSQGYDGGPAFPSRAAARKAIRAQVKRDLIDCRRKFGRAIVIKRGADVWEVAPMRDSHAPMWSRYSIHDG